MPIFAALFKAAILWLGAQFTGILVYLQAIAWARRLFIVALGLSLMATVGAVISGLLSFVASTAGVAGPFAQRFAMGLGMFIPSNAVGLMSGLAVVYLACLVYRLKLEAVRW